MYPLVWDLLKRLPATPSWDGVASSLETAAYALADAMREMTEFCGDQATMIFCKAWVLSFVRVETVLLVIQLHKADVGQV